MSIVSKMLWCAVCYAWMAHLALIVVYIEFAWNYVRFNSNDYYFMRFTHLRKSPNYANKSLNYFAVGDSWILVWIRGMEHSGLETSYKLQAQWGTRGDAADVEEYSRVFQNIQEGA